MQALLYTSWQKVVAPSSWQEEREEDGIQMSHFGSNFCLKIDAIYNIVHTS